MQRCAAGRESVFAASVRATHPALGSCMENTASVTTSPASDSEGSCVQVSNRSNGKIKRERQVSLTESRVWGGVCAISRSTEC